MATVMRPAVLLRHVHHCPRRPIARRRATHISAALDVCVRPLATVDPPLVTASPMETQSAVSDLTATRTSRPYHSVSPARSPGLTDSIVKLLQRAQPAGTDMPAVPQPQTTSELDDVSVLLVIRTNTYGRPDVRGNHAGQSSCLLTEFHRRPPRTTIFLRTRNGAP